MDAKKKALHRASNMARISSTFRQSKIASPNALVYSIDRPHWMTMTADNTTACPLAPEPLGGECS
jgi:hypothetical protein